MRIHLPLIVLCLLLGACNQPSSTDIPYTAEDQMHDRLEALKSLMIGNFNSGAQAEVDTNYYPISLNMCFIAGEEGKWFDLYVEQALTTKPENPYRQRIYHVAPLDSITFVSEIFALDFDSLFVGGCQSVSLKQQISAASKYKKEGCDVILTWFEDGHFEGGTSGESCRNSFGEASYATSVVHIDSAGVRSWDQGFDADGLKVWGPSGKGYDFLRE